MMDTPLREGLPPLPSRMRKLPIDERGYPVPWFVAWVDGKPEFRISDNQKWLKCVKYAACWVCGERVGKFKTFVIGPMCAVNRTTCEPGCHLDCAIFSATACPFLTLPKAKRNERNLPSEVSDPAGIAIKRNPGVTCLWVTQYHSLMYAGNGYLFRLGEPVGCTLVCREAPRDPRRDPCIDRFWHAAAARYSERR